MAERPVTGPCRRLSRCSVGLADTIAYGTHSLLGQRQPVLVARPVGLEHKRLPYESQLLHFDKQETSRRTC